MRLSCAHDIEGKVYDLTEYLSLHPTGRDLSRRVGHLVRTR
ncbi:MAG: hypothetical protein JJU27_08015 [Gammaproteobacteria bacterium]|nr:hypothetical protein [Gammaproteobacteria bacterium]